MFIPFLRDLISDPDVLNPAPCVKKELSDKDGHQKNPDACSARFAVSFLYVSGHGVCGLLSKTD
jgi:hypothetical protein